MNTLLPNLNAAPVAPSAPSVGRGFQADPTPSDSSQSFSNHLAKEVADRSAVSDNSNNQVKSGQNAPANQTAQNTQNAQQAQNSQNAENPQSAQNAQDAKDAADSGSKVDAKNDGKDTDKVKADKDAAAADSADKTSSELLALVAAGQSAAQLTPQQPVAAAQAVAAPIVADAKAGADKKDDAAIDADGKSSKTADLTQALPDAWNAKAGKDAKTDPAATFKVGTPAADNKAAANDAATGKTDAKTATAATQLGAAGGATATAAIAAKTPDVQALNATSAKDDNALFNPALQQAGNVASAAQASAADKLTPSVGSPDWDAALGQKMVWMTNNGQQTATLTLNPRDLGPMQVVVNVNKNQADATFIASNPEVKQALEAAMPKLREMMDQAGIQLGQANVSTGMPNQQQQAFNQPQRSGNGHRQGGGRDDDAANAGVEGGSIAIAPPNGRSGAGLGVVDTFV